MMHEPGRRPTTLLGHPPGFGHDGKSLKGTHRPADNVAGVEIEEDRDAEPADASRNEGIIGSQTRFFAETANS